jgi:hypothetical protein
MNIELQDFLIKDASLICPMCQTPFATPLLASMPEIKPQTTIEADLHRVLPDPRIRASLVAICPACIYTWWSTAFAPHFFVPDLLVPSPEIEYPKKFAHAVLTGRKHGAHALDRALLALNGLWCARETYTGASADQLGQYAADNERWLKLAAQELETALQDETWNGNRSRYSYIMGEILRQLGDFHAAVKYFDTVDRRCMLPRQLVRHQRQQALNGNSEPTTLPPFLVEQIFLPKPLLSREPEPEETVAPISQPQPVNAVS